MRSKLLTLLGGSRSNPFVVWEDKFLDARAAGSVDGTTVPGAFVGGVAVVRTVVDTGTDLSISGGQLVVAAGASAWGDPGIWWGLATPSAITFGALSGFLHTWTPAATSDNLVFGLDLNTEGSPIGPNWYFYGRKFFRLRWI